MHGKNAQPIPANNMIRQGIRDVVLAVTALRWWQWVLGVLVVVLAVYFVSSVAEFVVALHNRHSVYPTNYDTSMLAKSIGLTGVFSLGAAFLVGYIWKIVLVKWYVVALALLLSGLVCMVDSGTDWVAIPTLLVFAATVGLSFWTKIPFLVPLLGFCIMLVAKPSVLPEQWCRYELTMYKCADQIDYDLNIKR